MRHLFILFIGILFASTLYAQDAEKKDYVMFETIILTPDGDNPAAFMKAMKAHNQKYHGEDNAYNATVWNISSGPNVGKLVWMMGPLTFSDLDNRPGSDGHDEDWSNNVVPHIKKAEHGEYWRRDDKVSSLVNVDDPASMIYLRFYDISKDATSEQVDAHFEQVGKVMKKMNEYWALYSNQFAQGYKIGRHVVGVTRMDGWKDLDDEWKFKDTYVELYGETAWENFTDNGDRIFTNIYDEIWTVVPSMSPDTE